MDFKTFLTSVALDAVFNGDNRTSSYGEICDMAGEPMATISETRVNFRILGVYIKRNFDILIHF